MHELSPESALERLFEAGAATLTSERGPVEVTALAIVRDRLTGTAPRMEVAEGMQLEGRATDDDGEPWLVHLEIFATGIRSSTLADVKLRVVSVDPHPQRRRSVRVPSGGDARATAVHCLDIGDGTLFDVSMRDLSPEGVGFVTDARLSVGDRLILNIRRLSETITVDLRVVLVQPADHGRRRVGCSIIQMDGEDADRLERLTTLAAAPAAPAAPLVNLDSLRRASDDTGGWRDRLRRTR
jgi:hypothetical protein